MFWMDRNSCLIFVLTSSWLCYDQGKAPAFFADDLQGNFSNGLLLKSKGCETVINMGCSKTV